MKDVVDRLLKEDIILKKLHKIDNKLLNTRKKIEVYEGVDLKANYVVIFVIKQKSRFLRKDIPPLDLIYENLKTLQDHNFKKKIIIYDMPFCSHAQKELKSEKWRLLNATS
jgi:hypothetical protein